MGNDNAKLGLALSGGGFRAAFFHIGVMAKLAEAGLLKRVEVISTVSGGSIIGAYYHLHIKRVLTENADANLNDDDLQIVMRTIETEFRETVEKNARLLTFANLGANFKMGSLKYSRSDRFGEVLNKHFYLPVYRKLDPDRNGPITTRDTKIIPHGNKGFDPLRGNLARHFKVPKLVINATTLNTGHAWRFESETMGEPIPANRWEREVDRSLRLARAPHYTDMASAQEEVMLGKAVAASAAVPGLFQPLAISGLYNTRVQLADGGVFDNQGIDALIDEGCTHFIVSDAGGQLAGGKAAPSWAVGVLLRSQGIQYGRVRELGLERLGAAAGDDDRRIALVHTRRGVPPGTMPWLQSQEQQADLPSDQLPQLDEDTLPPPVHPATQELLATMRTDLDAFSEVEAHSLMLSGFLHAGKELKRATAVRALDHATETSPQAWSFLAIGSLVESTPAGSYRRQLKAARSRFFKPLRLMKLLAPLIAIVAYGPLLAIASWVGWSARHRIARWWKSLLDISWLHGLRHVFDARVSGGIAILIAIGGLLVAYLVIRYLPARLRLSVLSRVPGVSTALDRITTVVRMVIAVIAWAFVWASLITLNRLFLWHGKTSRLVN